MYAVRVFSNFLDLLLAFPTQLDEETVFSPLCVLSSFFFLPQSPALLSRAQTHHTSTVPLGGRDGAEGLGWGGHG